MIISCTHYSRTNVMHVPVNPEADIKMMCLQETQIKGHGCLHDMNSICFGENHFPSVNPYKTSISATKMDKHISNRYTNIDNTEWSSTQEVHMINYKT